MAKKDILVDFYLVSLPSGVKFNQILQVIHKADFDDRVMNINRNPIQLEQITRNNDGTWLGHLVKIRMDNPPRKAKVGKAGLTDLDLDPDEGIGEETSFLYDEGTNVLLFQRNFYGVRIEAFTAYLKRLYYFLTNSLKDLEVKFGSIVGEDAILKLGRQNVIRRIEATVALPDDPKVVKKMRQNKVLSGWIDNIEETGTEVLTVGMSMGRKRKATMIADSIKEAARLAIKESDMVSKFKVYSAEDEDERLEWIDLLEDRIHEYIQFDDVSRKNPLTHERMIPALRKVFKEREKELEALFRSQKV